MASRKPHGSYIYICQGNHSGSCKLLTCDKPCEQQIPYDVTPKQTEALTGQEKIHSMQYLQKLLRILPGVAQQLTAVPFCPMCDWWKSHQPLLISLPWGFPLQLSCTNTE